jgi:prepilin-type N-terminal cleavage/methylation domain-containing protein
MTNANRLARRRSGFTLLELIVSVGLVGTVTAAVTWMLAHQGQTYQVLDQTTEVQQNIRTISDLVERDLRVTGFIVAEAAAFCGQDNANQPDVMFVTDADSLMPGSGELGAAIISGFDGTGTDSIQVDSVVLDGAPFYDTDANATPDSDFRIGAGIIVVDPTNPARGASCGVIEDINGGNRIDVDYARGGGSIGAGGNLVAIPAHYYAIDAQSQLVRDGMVLSDGAEDLQFALFYDLDDDGDVDANTEDPGAYGSGLAYQSENWDNSTLLEIRFNVVARTAAPDPQWASGQFQATENRAPIAGTDNFRRRVFTASVRPRNVGQRGGI